MSQNIYGYLDIFIKSIMCTINNESTIVIILIRDTEEKEREGYGEAPHLHLKYLMSLVKRNRADEDLQ